MRGLVLSSTLRDEPSGSDSNEGAVSPEAGAVEGFSLIEVLVAGVATLILGGLLVGILSNSSTTFYKENIAVSQGVDLNRSVNRTDNLIRQASTVVTGYPEDDPTYSSSQQVLVLKLPSLGESGTLTNKYDFAVLTPDSGNAKILRLQIFPDPQSQRVAESSVLTTMLEALKFSYLDKDGNSVSPNLAERVGVDLTISGRMSSQIISLRNQ